MTNHIKVNLSITLPGSVLLSEQECSKNPKENYEVLLVDISPLYFKGKPEKVPIKLRKTRPATQVVNINSDAYNYMTSSKSFSEVGYTLKEWQRMSLRQRLEAHLRRIAAHNGGKVKSYTIFED